MFHSVMLLHTALALLPCFLYSKQDGPFTNERGANGGGWQCVGDDDEEDGVSQQQSDLEGYSLPAVRGEVETHYIHHHQEYAGEK